MYLYLLRSKILFADLSVEVLADVLADTVVQPKHISRILAYVLADLLFEFVGEFWAESAGLLPDLLDEFTMAKFVADRMAEFMTDLLSGFMVEITDEFIIDWRYGFERLALHRYDVRSILLSNPKMYAAFHVVKHSLSARKRQRCGDE